jgi:hypothetical protein
VEVEEVEGLRALKTGFCRKGPTLEVQRRRFCAGIEECWHILGAVGQQKMISWRRDKDRIAQNRHAELVSASINT